MTEVKTNILKILVLYIIHSAIFFLNSIIDFAILDSKLLTWLNYTVFSFQKPTQKYELNLNM